MAAVQTRLTLLALPHEILLQICEHSLPSLIAVGKILCQQDECHKPHRVRNSVLKSQFPTLYTCRLLSQITSSILYTIPAYQLHVASPSTRWQYPDRLFQDRILKLHGGNLRKVTLFIELYKDALCCWHHCPDPVNFSRSRCDPKHRVSQKGTIYMCTRNLKQIVCALVSGRKMKITRLELIWYISSQFEPGSALAVLAPLAGLRGWVTEISVQSEGWAREKIPFRMDIVVSKIVSDLVLKEQV